MALILAEVERLQNENISLRNEITLLHKALYVAMKLLGSACDSGVPVSVVEATSTLAQISKFDISFDGECDVE